MTRVCLLVSCSLQHSEKKLSCGSRNSVLPHAWSKKLLVAQKPVDEASHGQVKVSVARLFRRDIAPEADRQRDKREQERETHTDHKSTQPENEK